jgi:hypothetical protein
MHSSFDDKRRERIMQAENLPAYAREYLLKAAIFTLTEMPEDIAEQRAVMLQQEKDYGPSGQPEHFGIARFDNVLTPSFASFPEYVTSSVFTVHDLRNRPESYLLDGAPTHLTLGIGLSDKWSDGTAHSPKAMLEMKKKLEKFWRQVAQIAGLEEKEHDIVRINHFGIHSFDEDRDRYCGLEFHPVDYKLVLVTLREMLKEVKIEAEAERAIGDQLF